MLKVFTKEGCSKCNIIKRMLTQQNVPFEEVDAEPYADMLKDKGFNNLPVVEDNGNYYSFREALDMARPCATCELE